MFLHPALAHEGLFCILLIIDTLLKKQNKTKREKDYENVHMTDRQADTETETDRQTNRQGQTIGRKRQIQR